MTTQTTTSPLYCYECIHWEPDAPELGYCSHDRTHEFEDYFNACAQADAVIDANDCPGFESEEV